MLPKLRIYLNFKWPKAAVKYATKTILQEGHEVSGEKLDSIVWNIIPELIVSSVIKYTSPPDAFYFYSNTKPEIKVTQATWPEMTRELLALELQWLKEKESAE